MKDYPQLIITAHRKRDLHYEDRSLFELKRNIVYLELYVRESVCRQVVYQVKYTLKEDFSGR